MNRVGYKGLTLILAILLALQAQPARAKPTGKFTVKRTTRVFATDHGGFV